MQPRTRVGIIVGLISLVLNVCVSGALSILSNFCGPVIALITGAIAGSFAVRQEKPATKTEGARAGGTAGGIAGALTILGPLLVALGILLYLQTSGTPIDVQVPDLSSAPGTQIEFYARSLGTLLWSGIVGILFAAGAGAGMGYLLTSEQPMPPASQDIIG
jgi:hypothetical protein